MTEKYILFYRFLHENLQIYETVCLEFLLTLKKAIRICFLLKVLNADLLINKCKNK